MTSTLAPAVRSGADAAALRMRQSIHLSPAVRPCQWTADLSEFFFPQKLPLDAAGVHLHVEIVLHQFCQLNETQRWLRGSLLGHKLHHFRSELVTVSRAPLLGKQSGQTALLEGKFRLVKRRAGETKLLGR